MRRITEQLAQMTGGWRGLPVTVGLLVALVGGAIAVVHAMDSVGERTERAIERAIKQHDQSVGAHAHIQQGGEGCCNELRVRVRQLEAQWQEVCRKRCRRR